MMKKVALICFGKGKYIAGGGERGWRASGVVESYKTNHNNIFPRSSQSLVCSSIDALTLAKQGKWWSESVGAQRLTRRHFALNVLSKQD